MTRILFEANKTPTPTVMVPIALGGTDANTAVDAMANLDGLAFTDIGAPLGAVPLNELRLVPPPYLPVVPASAGDTVYGDTTLFTNSLVRFEITNYDSSRAYALEYLPGIDHTELPVPRIVTFAEVLDCTVWNGQNEVQQECYFPGCLLFSTSMISGTDGFILNGRTYSFTVLDPYMNLPSIIAPSQGELLTNGALVSITSLQPTVCGFENNAYGNTPFFTEAVCEVADNALFTNPQSVVVTNALYPGAGSVFEFTGLPSGTLYARVRYTEGNLGFSEYSPTVTFTVPAGVTYPQSPSALLLGSEQGGVGTHFSENLAISDDGTVVAVAGSALDPTGLAYQSVVYIFRKINGSYTEELMIGNSGVPELVGGPGNGITRIGNGVNASGDFLRSVLSLSGDGNTLCLGNQVYSYSPTTQLWSTELVLVSYTEGANYGEGAWVYETSGAFTGAYCPDRLTSALSYDGNTLAVGAASVGGRITVFKRSAGAWFPTATLNTPYADYAYYTWSDWLAAVSISANGQRILVRTDGLINPTPNKYVAGVVYVETMGTWAVEGELITQDNKVANSLTLSGVGDTILLGVWNDSLADVKSGSVRIFKPVTGVWTEVDYIVPMDAFVDQSFGWVTAINAAGTLAAVGCFNQIDATTGNKSGVIYLFAYDGFWNQVAEFGEQLTYYTNEQLGAVLKLTADGGTLFASELNYQGPMGAVQVFV